MSPITRAILVDLRELDQPFPPPPTILCRPSGIKDFQSGVFQCFQFMLLMLTEDGANVLFGEEVMDEKIGNLAGEYNTWGYWS